MIKNKYFIILLLIVSSAFLAQARANQLKAYITELEQRKDIINNSLCKQPDQEQLNTQYQHDLQLVKETYALAISVFETPDNIPETAVVSKEAFAFTYKSKATGRLIKRKYKYADGFDGFFDEEFKYKEAQVKVRYKTVKGKHYLVDIEMKYPNDLGVYYDSYQLPFTCKVYTKKEEDSISYATKRLTLRYARAFPYRLQDIMILASGRDRYNWYIHNGDESMRCFDEQGEEILPLKITEKTIKPKVYLLWYEGTIKNYPIKLMLKTQYNKEHEEYRVENVLYGYDSQQKWIEIQNLQEPQYTILGDEKDKDDRIVGHWDLDYEMNKNLTGYWDDSDEKVRLPIALKPLTKVFPDYTFKAQLETTLDPRGVAVSDEKTIRSISIYKKNKKIQEIKIDDGTPLEYLDFGYVDLNYDGYLDLMVSNAIYFYEPKKQRFIRDTKEEYYPYLEELGQYNLFDKSFIVQRNRSMLELRAVNGKLVPFHASSYYPNAEDEMVTIEKDYVNGKWVTVSKVVEKIEDKEPVDDDDVDVSDPINYGLEVDLTVQDGSLYFSPDFFNKTGIKIEFKEKAKLFVELKDEEGAWHQQYLYEVPLNGQPDDMLDDNPMVWTGKEHLLFPGSGAGLIPFFPSGMDAGEYTFRLQITHPLFGKVYSKLSPISLPLGLKKVSTVLHFSGSINDVVNGDIYYSTREKVGTFINAKTGQQIHLKGSYVQGLSGGDELNLVEYGERDKLTGYFKGNITKGIYKGLWLSPDKTTARVPFEFKQVDK